MKKIMMTLVAAFAAMSMNAQVYVGGTAGIGSVKVGDNNNETAYKLLPEVGYNLSDQLAVGVSLGWTKGDLNIVKGNINANSSRTFEFNPYVRYTFLQAGKLNVFTDLQVNYEHYNGAGDGYGVGLLPGLAVNLTDNISFVTKVGFVGWQHAKVYGIKADVFGVDLDATNVQFGLYFNL